MAKHKKYSKTKISMDEYGEWICLCGNKAIECGFFPCDLDGNEVEPTPEDWTTDCYVCDKCGRIINQSTLQIVGHREINQ
jgi:hypothetical protein